MKATSISFAVGMLVGLLYAVLRVRSPAPPLIALAGLLGMVWGEQLAQHVLARLATVTVSGAKPPIVAVKIPVDSECKVPARYEVDSSR
jgi:XapX domain-containing protein